MSWFRRKEQKIEYNGFRRSPYTLWPIPSDCWVYRGDTHLATFENLSFCRQVTGKRCQSPRELTIEHFAVTGRQKGKGIGEEIVRGFAAVVAEKAPTVCTIRFILQRATPSSNLEKLAAARVELFKRIGAEDINTEDFRPTWIRVSATWHEAQWR